MRKGAGACGLRERIALLSQVENIDRVVLRLKPGITGSATLKYRLEDEMLEEFVLKARSEVGGLNLDVALPDVNSMSDQELAVWYNDNVIYPDKVRLNKWYYEHYSFWKDIEMIFATVLGRKVRFGGEEI